MWFKGACGGRTGTGGKGFFFSRRMRCGTPQGGEFGSEDEGGVDSDDEDGEGSDEELEVERKARSLDKARWVLRTAHA